MASRFVRASKLKIFVFDKAVGYLVLLTEVPTNAFLIFLSTPCCVEFQLDTRERKLARVDLFAISVI